MHEVPKSILAATDFSDTADRAVALARDLARRFAAELHLLHVVVLLDDAHLEGEHRDELERLITTGEKARRAILEGATRESPGVTAKPHLVRGLAPDEVILESASEIGVDLIVICTDGRDNIKDFVTGTITEHVINHASCPVLVIPYPKSS